MPRPPKSPATIEKAAKRRPLEWDEKLKAIILLVFEGRLSQAKIAERCGVALRTCEYWIAHPDFQARLSQMRTNILDELMTHGVAYVGKEQRIMALAQMAEHAREQYEERPWLQEVRPLPQKAALRIKGKHAQDDLSDGQDETDVIDAVTNESYNRDAFDAFRGALDDIAKELGHRKPSMEVTGKDGGPIETNVLFVLPEFVDALPLPPGNIVEARATKMARHKKAPHAPTRPRQATRTQTKG